MWAWRRIQADCLVRRCVMAKVIVTGCIQVTVVSKASRSDVHRAQTSRRSARRCLETVTWGICGSPQCLARAWCQSAVEL